MLPKHLKAVRKTHYLKTTAEVGGEDKSRNLQYQQPIASAWTWDEPQRIATGLKPPAGALKESRQQHGQSEVAHPVAQHQLLGSKEANTYKGHQPDFVKCTT